MQKAFHYFDFKVKIKFKANLIHKSFIIKILMFLNDDNPFSLYL